MAIGGGQLQILGAGEAVWERARGAAPAKQSSTPKERTPRQARGRSASTLRHLLAAAEERLASVQIERDELAAALEAASDHTEMAEIGTRLTASESELAAAEEEWLELASEAEDQD